MGLRGEESWPVRTLLFLLILTTTEEIVISQRIERTIIKFQLVSSGNLGAIIFTETTTDGNKKSNQRNFWKGVAPPIISKTP